MYKSIGLHEFYRLFEAYNKEQSFSFDGKKALYDHLEQEEEDSGTMFVVDIVVLCTEYTEYDSYSEYQTETGSECGSIANIEAEKTVIHIDPVKRYQDYEGRFLVKE
jgi:hypothetical protein